MANLGLDLGTTNTVVATMAPTGEPVIIEVEDSAMIPSVIFIEPEGGNSVLGEAAVPYWSGQGSDPGNCFRGWKVRMGDSACLKTISLGQGAKPIKVTPEYLTTMMVEYLLSQVTRGDGGERVEEVLVTVPHGWRRNQAVKCRATRTAAAEAVVNGQNVKIQNMTVSEPVAAAAYWIWEHQRANRTKTNEDLTGKVVLVVDIGGGTFDLSLIRVGGLHRPLDVLAATNSNYAGDYVDHILCAWVCEQFNSEFKTNYPTDPEGVSREINSTDPEVRWLRKWVLDIRTALKEEMSTNVLSARRIKRTAQPTSVSLDDAQNHHMNVKLTPEQFDSCLGPFYDHGQELLRCFLEQTKSNPVHAVVFCGGGSKTVGVRERIVEPVLRETYGNEAESIIERMPVNPKRVAHAVALGAALIANGVVSVKENLLHDIGIRLHAANPHLVQALKADRDSGDFVLSPVLAKGTTLPASRSNLELGINSHMPSGNLEVQVYVFDDLSEPHNEKWEFAHQGVGSKADWQVEVDGEGVLTVTVTLENDEKHTMACSLERERVNNDPARPGTLIVGPPQSKVELPVVTPEHYKSIVWSLGEGGAL